jgi:tetraacyldisaccharide-1-P 4'-kinase
MVNGLAPWGNTHFIPRGPMREPLSALGRADIVIIHNADMVCGNREITVSYLVLLYSLLL